MRGKLKRTLSAALACLMVLSLLSVNALAAGSSTTVLTVGTSTTLTADSHPGCTYTWTSSAPSVLDVSGSTNTATLTPLRAGFAEVTLTCQQISDPSCQWTDSWQFIVVKVPDTTDITAGIGGLSVSSSVDKTAAVVGDTLTYTIDVENTSKITLKNITVIDTLRNASGSVTISKGSGYTVNADGTVTIAALAPGASVTITAAYTITAGDAGKTINITVSAESGIIQGSGSSDGTSIELPTRPTLNTRDHTAYIIGYKDGTVKPNNKITRAEVTTIFFRLLTDESRTQFWCQTNSSSDVSLTNWFNNAVSTLSNAGVITGYPNGTFRPNSSITRAEFAAIAVRFSDEKADGACSFTDVPETHWAADSIALAEDLGWVNGYPDGTFRPNQPITPS